ncbi:MAG: metallophosphoesterase [Bacteroidetes bacterium]|nr:metallophosphoesterase [Bacteroidota bacterium]MBU1578773.1 metallophosphoesterase [Bacteroidota bacterium]MBU2466882.1 metallophosphoesterase [Bacteroidota bacterium]MBU2558564.1 metallophosphoesterase [Bacteroidota bacterium]
MKIQYCSDLHLEFAHNNHFLTEKTWEISGEVLLLAGDIAPLHDIYYANSFFSYLSANYKAVFWVPGNHEYYHHDLIDFKTSFHFKIRENIHLLQNTNIVYEGINFVFSTLWTYLNELNMPFIEKGIADFASITRKGKRLNGYDYNQLHEESLSFIKAELDKTTHPTVVVTHHLPSVRCNSPEHVESELNEAYCVDLTAYIKDCKADFWIYGHSHFNQKPLIIGKTMLLTNQLGMVSSNEHNHFRNAAYFSL